MTSKLCSVLRLSRGVVLCSVVLRLATGLECYAIEPAQDGKSGVQLNPISKPVVPDKIKSYCIDFNWARTGRAVKPFAAPGTWAEADPAAHVAWYKAVGANVIQTFAVSCNGYAWYKNGVVPEQPGLKHDFLREVVRLGHKDNMLVFGYFCAAANVKWVMDHPDLNYPQAIDMKKGYPQSMREKKCVVYTDEYLEYLSSAIKDAVGTTGIDGFMIDWMWMPERSSRSQGGALDWVDAEKKLYQQLMGKPFPGKDKLTKAEEIAYSRKAIDRCWKAIRKAAKETNPNCIIWLTVSKLDHPHVVNSEMYQEADWLMNEAGDMKRIHHVQSMIGPKTKLVSCMAAWNGAEPTTVIPEALNAGVGLYGFTAPSPGDSGLVKLDKFMDKPISELKGDERNIATLARFYHGVGLDAVWNGKDGFLPARQATP